MTQEIADVKKLELDLKNHSPEDVIKKDIATLVDEIFGVGKYIIIKLEGDK